MDLFLRKVQHPQARNNFRVIVKTKDGEVEIGSIGVQFDGWHWGIDTVVPLRALKSEGSGRNLPDCIRQFRKAWDQLSSDEANLTAFLEMKRKR